MWNHLAVHPFPVLVYDRYSIHSLPDHFLTVDDWGCGHDLSGEGPETVLSTSITGVPIHQRTVIQSADDHAGDFRGGQLERRAWT